MLPKRLRATIVVDVDSYESSVDAARMLRSWLDYPAVVNIDTVEVETADDGVILSAVDDEKFVQISDILGGRE
jgi:hypothetical protein